MSLSATFLIKNLALKFFVITVDRKMNRSLLIVFNIKMIIYIYDS